MFTLTCGRILHHFYLKLCVAHVMLTLCRHGYGDAQTDAGDERITGRQDGGSVMGEGRGRTGGGAHVYSIMSSLVNIWSPYLSHPRSLVHL